MNKRLLYGLLLGGILGIFCIIGATLRSEVSLSFSYLFSFWYNRVIMGLIIGLLPSNQSIKLLLIRGFFIGGLVSLAFYSATDFNDLMGFLAGFIYGVIIEYVLYKFQFVKEDII